MLEEPSASRLAPQEGVSECTELGAKASVEDDAADDRDRATDELGVDTHLDVDLVTRACREGPAQALELVVGERARRDDLRLHTAGRFVCQPLELCTNAGEVDEAPLVDEKRHEVADHPAGLHALADCPKNRAPLCHWMQWAEERVLEIRVRLEEAGDLLELAPHPFVIARLASE